jgi:hypothetical protein
VLSDRFARFHAGAVAFAQHGILLPGPQRCGKSTLTLGLLLRGGRYLSEDVAVLEHESLQLMPCGAGISLRPDGITTFPELMGRWLPIPSKCDGDPYEQVAFTSPDLLGASVAEGCPLTMIVFPSYDTCDRPARMEALTPAQAVLRLLQSCIDLGANMDRGLDIVIAIAEKAESYSLEYHDAGDARDRIIERANAENRTATGGHHGRSARP